MPFTVAVYLVLAKYGIALQNCQTKVYRGFSASLRYIERKSAIEATTKPRGIPILPFTVTGIPLAGKNKMSLKTAKLTYTVDLPPVYGTLNENQLY